jgi:hypothetical protein
MTAPKLGEFVLHARAVPPLKAGEYTLIGHQDVTGGVVEDLESHVNVTAPRFTMPPEQILSTFPPANAVGGFELRLPQVVLKRRTLPWDRRPEPDSADSEPWLALVVIAEGEGQLSGETPVAQCFTAGAMNPDPADVPSSVYLAVSRTVVEKVFPTRADVSLLAHVRQVDPSDTELALGDEDGYLAVVLANRFPQYHRSSGPDDADQPVRYLACLISLEGQMDVLPVPPPFQVTFVADAVVLDLAVMAAERSDIDVDHYVMGTGSIAAEPQVLRAAGPTTGRATGPAAAAAGQTVAAPNRGASAAKASVASWAAAPIAVERVAVSAATSDAARLVRDAMGVGFRYPVELLVTEPTYRFPVLAHWSFTVDGGGSFETLMRELDVGLLGTAPPDPSATAPPTPAIAVPPPPAPTREPPELTDTGHVGLSHLTRAGDQTRAWYRGPLTPRPVQYDERDPTVRLPLAHVSDQLRRVTPDGREDLGLAAAFEIGRLLALSQPSIVSSLTRWRREEFGRSRAKRYVEHLVADVAMFDDLLELGLVDGDLGRLVSRRVVLATAADREAVLAPNRPIADPGRPISFLRGDLDAMVVKGLGLDADQLAADVEQFGLVAALARQDAPVAVEQSFDAAAARQLRDHLSGVVESLAADVLQADRPTPRGGSRASTGSRDALDELLARARRRT